jgi:dienelactone hydrolase
MRATAPPLACLLLTAAAATIPPSPARAHTVTEAFDALLVLPDGSTRHLPALFHSPDAAGPRPALVIVPDEAGIDGRSNRLADRAVAAGWVAVETDPDAVSLDWASALPPREPRRLGDWLRAFAGILATDPRVDPHRIAVVGLGSGGRAALHAAASAPKGPGASAAPAAAFAAHAAFYPGCDALAAEGAAPPAVPALVLLPGADEPPGACGELDGDRLRLERLEGATYAWDLPEGSAAQDEARRRLGDSAANSVQPDPGAAAAAERSLMRFLRDALGG